MANIRFRTGVFISYSHKDKKWLRHLHIAVAPAMHGDKLQVWGDTQIQVGSKWETELMEAVDRLSGSSYSNPRYIPGRSVLP